MKAHCLFEQSGTFKKEFKKLGIDAIDYDICNDFNETDNVIDLLNEIRGGYENKPSIFDEMKEDDLVIAFFPCTRFQENNFLWRRGLASQQKNKSLEDRLENSIKWFNEINEMYKLLNQLVIVCIRKNLKLVIENPAHPPHILSLLWIPSTFTDMNRRENGDYYVKPTQYWFINWKPYDNFIFEPLEKTEKRTINHIRKTDSCSQKVLRSMIHPQYARRFIMRYLLNEKQFEENQTKYN